MAINKKTREAVYRKYGGRCAYCGRAIAYKDMQVDHFRPLRVWDEVDGAADDISNLMPACRMCNHYKRANSLEVFRRYIAEIPRKLRDNYIYKIGVAYRNIIENERPIKFFFETEEAKTNPEYAITSPEDMAHYLMDFAIATWQPEMVARAARLINRPATTGMESAVYMSPTTGIFEEV